MRAEVAYGDCMDDCDESDRTDEEPDREETDREEEACEEECGGLWREAFADCLDGGGSEEACEARADEAYDACMDECEEEGDDTTRT